MHESASTELNRDALETESKEAVAAAISVQEAATLSSAANDARQVVIVGGGAGGLELAVKLAKRYKRRDDTDVVLIDKNPTHIWKPLLHEVATGSMNSYHDEASYRLLAKKHGFRFLLGRVDDIDIVKKRIILSSVHDTDGQEMMPGRVVSYDFLTVSVGSQSNDYNIPGVATHSKQLDSREQAEVFHKEFTLQLHRVNARQDVKSVLSVVIIGGGATGVELAADMHNVVQRLKEYGFEALSRERLQVSIIEAAPGLLPRLPDRIGASVQLELARIGVNVKVATRVSEVTETAVITSEGENIPADISVWAAGVKAPSWLADCGFPVDRLGRIEVNGDLSVKELPGVYAIGDCCSCYTDDGVEVPPRAQAAHQMAAIAAHNIRADIDDRGKKDFVYRDFGSLVSLSKFSTIGNLMGNLVRGTVFVEGWIARMVYLSLYRLHQRAIHGTLSMFLIMLGDRIYKATRAAVKLH